MRMIKSCEKKTIKSDSGFIFYFVRGLQNTHNNLTVNNGNNDPPKGRASTNKEETLASASVSSRERAN